MKNKGIALIVLVICIVVMIILASASIMVMLENGIITKANDAKMLTVVANLKEEISNQRIEQLVNGNEITLEQLFLNKKINRIVKNDNEKYIIYYVIIPEMYSSTQGYGNGSINELKDVFLLDEKFNIKYIDKNGKEYGDNIYSEELTDETSVKFSSKSFSQYVSKMSGIAEEDMKFKWMKNQTTLVIDDKNITSLNDLIFFPNLERLTIMNEVELENLDGIENCLKLRDLYIYGKVKDLGKLRDLDNLQLLSIRYLQDFDNMIDSIKTIANLKALKVSGNIVVKSMKRVEELSNSITDINLQNLGINKIEGLNNFTNLKTITLNNNKIKDITPLADINSIDNIKILDLSGNKDINGNRSDYTEKQLEKIDKIGQIIERNGRIDLEIDQLGLFTNHKNIQLIYKKIETLDIFKDMNELESLNLTGNKITLKDENSQNILKSKTKLKSLYLTENKLITLKPINELKNLTFLDISKNPTLNLVEIEDIISNLTLNVDTETFKTIVNCDPNKITSIKISWSFITEIPDMSCLNKLTYLKIDNINKVTDFTPISKLVTLETLVLESSSLHGKMFDFSKLTNLKSLNLSSNALWTEELENLKALKNNKNLTIDLSNNAIVDATALLELDSSTKINLKGNVNLNKESKNKLKEKFGNKVSF